MKKFSHVLYIVAGVLVIGAGLFLQQKWQKSDSGSDVGESRVKAIENVNGGGREPVKSGKSRRRSHDSGSSVEVQGKALKEKPVLDDADESELSKLQASVLRQLREALDDNSLPRVRKAVAKFNLPKSQGGLGGDVPKVMRSHAVSALGWFGSSAASDLIDFMADMDPEIEEDAFQNFEQALDDWDISDRERADILKTLMRALHDTDRIDMMLMALNNMRNSVKGQTILDIMSSGTQEARAMMREQLEFFTDFDVTDASAVSDWIKNNPDNEWDDEFYGANKD